MPASLLDRTPTPSAFRRRRAVAVLLLAVTAGTVGMVGCGGVLAGNVVTGPGGVPASAAGTGTSQGAVRAREGDSLWSIAEVFHGDASLGRYVEALISLNGGTRIEAGEIVRLP
jgi:hypothetical protein